MGKRGRMKILIAYDGSDSAESAIDDLKRAGLPPQAEAIVLTIAEELIPDPARIGGVATIFAKKLLAISIRLPSPPNPTWAPSTAQPVITIWRCRFWPMP